MDIPTTAVEAARVLVDLADGNPVPVSDDTRELVVPPGWLERFNPTPARREGVPAPVDTLTAWRALTPQTTRRLARVAEYRGVDRELPEVVRVNGVGLVAQPARPGARPVFAVPALDAALPSKRPAYVRDAHALTLGAVSARLAADRVEAWIPALLASEASKARREVDAYRSYAANAVDLFPQAFAWLVDVELEPVSPAFPTVPAVVRGIAREGIT